MAMFVWPDGSVTGSVNVAELEKIRAAQKAASKKQLAGIVGPIESAAQLAELLGGETEPEPAPAPEPAPEAESAPAKARETPKKEKS